MLQVKSRIPVLSIAAAGFILGLPITVWPASDPPAVVEVEILEGLPDKPLWELDQATATTRFDVPAFGLVCLPQVYNEKGLRGERRQPFVVSARARVQLPAGEHRFMLRSRNATRLLIDGQVVVETSFLRANTSGNEAVPEVPPPGDPRLPPLSPGHQEQIATVSLDGQSHEFQLQAFVGGRKLRPEIGEVSVAVMQADAAPRLLGPVATPPLTEESWLDYIAESRNRQQQRDRAARHEAGATEARYWAARHDVARREVRGLPALDIPAVGRRDAIHNDVDRWINVKLEAAGVVPGELADDAAFLRRVTLDTIGLIPTRDEIEAFLADQSEERKSRVIDRLLNDPRWADHWVGYWQDVLAENPGILKPTLNNTGPFRWWIHESFQDGKPFDQFVTELIRMEGASSSGGPAGFSLATQNDAPLAAKAHIVAKAFLGLEMQCARCHDAPFHPFHQQDLFSLAAMLANKPQAVPPTSSVIASERTRRPLIEVTLEPGVPVAPEWPFADLAPAELPEGLAVNVDRPQERLAAIVTSPRNQRFAQVIVNRLWQRYLGAGIVEPVDDWNDARPSHPELLDYLARELVTHDYDLKHVARLILNSHTYQRAIVLPPDIATTNATGDHSTQRAAGLTPAVYLFASPVRRRLTAEQLVDSLFFAAGKPLGCEELTMDPEGRRPITEMINLGTPSRAWELTSLSNERDRPALALPMAQSIVDVLTSYGWRESRQNPLTVREDSPTVLQPLVLANGVAGTRITRLSDDSALTSLALQEQPVQQLVQAVFRQVLSRDPAPGEARTFVALLHDGYDERRTQSAQDAPARRARPATAVSWANHLSPEATRMKLDLERVAREGDPPTNRLRADWRERMEDMVWSLVNSPEFAFVP